MRALDMRGVSPHPSNRGAALPSSVALSFSTASEAREAADLAFAQMPARWPTQVAASRCLPAQPSIASPAKGRRRPQPIAYGRAGAVPGRGQGHDELPLQFLGLPAGISTRDPTVSPDGTEARLPMVVLGDEPDGSVIGAFIRHAE